jgi:zinc/manganese transport system substrate-binding protein
VQHGCFRRPLGSLTAFVSGITLVLGAILATGCGRAGTPTSNGTNAASTSGIGKVQIVAAENFWASIAAQIAGNRGEVSAIIADPAQDPHDYQPTTADARAVSGARLAIVNGVGYDRWASQLLSASPAPHRVVLNVGKLFALKEGDNPHRWYDPADVEAVANRIAEDLKRVDPAHAGVYDQQLASFEQRQLAHYHALIAGIARRYAGVSVGASESIFAMQAPSLGLRLITPPAFMNAISEGSDVSAQDLLTAQRQITGRQIKVWIYNRQNATPQIQRLNALARAHGIPVVTVTETLTPESASFEEWQSDQLSRLAQALREATRR